MIAALTEVLFAGGGNLEDASMHQLSGQFAMTLVVSVPGNADSVRAELEPVGRAHELADFVAEAAAIYGFDPASLIAANIVIYATLP